MADVKEPSRKRKLNDDNELEINLAAPVPPSKKALRKAKKKSSDTKSSAADGSGDDAKQPEKPSSAKPAENQRTGFGIWIGNLHFSTTREDLRTFLTARGSFNNDQITRIHLPTVMDKRAGKVQNRGFAYVDFTTKEAVKQAIALSEQESNGRRLLIKDASSYEGRPEKSADSGAASKSKNPPARKIFVGNLSFDVTKEMLEEHFAPCGNIAMVHMASFEDSGKCKGFGWVEFELIESAEAAVRGFTRVPDEDEMEDSGAEESNEESDEKPKKKAKKSHGRKKWVNRMMGRNLRMEFAEDSSTRYDKRFGKNAKPRHIDGQGAGAHGNEGADDSAPAIEEVSETQDKPRHFKDDSSRYPKPKPKPKESHSRYSNDTVQRLTGGIVEATGKKVTFD